MITAILSFAFLSIAQAQPEIPSNSSPVFSNLKQAGKVFTVEVVPEKTKFLKLFIAGKKAAEVNAQDYSVNVFYGKDKKQLKATPKGKYFLIDRPNLSATDLKVLVDQKGKSEEFTFKLK